MLQCIPLLDTGFFAKVGVGRREWEEGEGEKRERGAVFDAEGGIPEFPAPKQSFRSSFLPSSSPSSLLLPILSLLLPPPSPSPLSPFPFFLVLWSFSLYSCRSGCIGYSSYSCYIPSLMCTTSEKEHFTRPKLCYKFLLCSPTHSC